MNQSEENKLKNKEDKDLQDKIITNIQQENSPNVQDNQNQVVPARSISGHFTFIYGTVLWFSFFIPLAAQYQIENAFALPYIGVHALCLYGGLALFSIVSWPAYTLLIKRGDDSILIKGNLDKSPQLEKMVLNNIFVSVILAFVGASVKLLSFINYKENGIFVLYAIGQLFIIVGLVIYFQVAIFYSKYIHKNYIVLNDTFAAIPTGMVLASILVHSVFVDSDKFFTKVARCQIKNMAIMTFNWFLFLVLFIIVTVKFCKFTKNQQQEGQIQENPQENEQDNQQNYGKVSSICSKITRAQPFAILLAIFFFIYLKLTQYPLMFWFTQNEAEVILAFFSVGFLLGALNGGILVVAFLKDKYRAIQIWFFSLFTIFVIVLEVTISLGNIWLPCVFCFMIGLSLALLISQQLALIDLPKNSKNYEESEFPTSRELTPIVTFSLTIFGIYGSIICFVGERLHYMNRDENTWSYVMIGSIIGFVFLALCFSFDCSVNGCKCCIKCCCCEKACCQRDRACCGGKCCYGEDDVEDEE